MKLALRAGHRAPGLESAFDRVEKWLLRGRVEQA
jgi:hypothetical protein